MKYRKLNDGDYTFGGNTNDFYSGVEAVSQAIRTSLLLLYGEWWESIDRGLPLFQRILGQTGLPENLQAVDLLVQDVIANTQDVIGITSFQSDYGDRQYSLSCKVDTKYGEAAVEVTF